MRRLFLISCLVWVYPLCTFAQTTPDELEERLVADLSKDRVPLSVDFNGSEILIFGAIERSRFLGLNEGRPDVIVNITGPNEPLIVRKKDQIFGIYANTESEKIAIAPSFFATASTRSLDEIFAPDQKKLSRVSLDAALRTPVAEEEGRDQPTSFQIAATRILRTSGLYVEVPYGVKLVGDSLFASSISLPANIVEGDYRVRVLLIRDGMVLDAHVTNIFVRKSGLQRWIYRMARDRPALYGILSIVAALFAGWAASSLFSRWRVH